MALINKLNNLGDSIRAKTGKTDLMTLEEMAAAVDSIESTKMPDEAFIITGDCRNRFAYGGWDWFIEMFGDKIVTKDIGNNVSSMFDGSHVEYIPFDLNFTGGESVKQTFTRLFATADIKELPNINMKTMVKLPTSNFFYEIGDMFYYCSYLREIPFDYLNRIVPDGYWDLKETYKANGVSKAFQNCYSLRSYCDLKPFIHYGSASYSFYSMYSNLFSACASLDEVNNLLVETVAYTSNAFSSTFSQCFRLKKITFETNEDGSPIAVTWKNQTIDLTKVGYVENEYLRNYVVSYNSGITDADRVTDDASYQALKNSENWYTSKIDYSRYNHNSAVETINSLPDVSAGSSNTIKFKGAAGALTDGGAINTLTEEEIAVAAAKGWTVTLT